MSVGDLTDTTVKIHGIFPMGIGVILIAIYVHFHSFHSQVGVSFPVPQDSYGIPISIGNPIPVVISSYNSRLLSVKRPISPICQIIILTSSSGIISFNSVFLLSITPSLFHCRLRPKTFFPQIFPFVFFSSRTGSMNSYSCRFFWAYPFLFLVFFCYSTSLFFGPLR